MKLYPAHRNWKRRPTPGIASILVAALLAALLQVGAMGCGNGSFSASCNRSCEADRDECFALAGIWALDPDGERLPYAILYANCQSSYYTCVDSCVFATGRL